MLQMSVASISSEVAGEAAREEQLLELLRPAAAMAEAYCRAACGGGGHSLSQSEHLESVNPPSLLLELTETLDPDPGTFTLASDSEPEEELPADWSVEATPPQRRRATPKQRRQAMKQRYDTYTIEAEAAPRPAHLPLQLGQRPTPLPDAPPPAANTPKQRRQLDKQRYLTQTVQPPPPPPPADEDHAHPKIVKPLSQQEGEAGQRGVRGRRKALYAKPSSTAAAPKLPKAPAGPTIRPTRASALRQRSSSPRAPAPAASRTPSTPASPKPPPSKLQKPQAGAARAPKPPHNSPDAAAPGGPPPPPPRLLKQGTFTKDSTEAKGSRIPVRSPSADTLAPAAPAPAPASAPRAKSRLLRRDAIGPAPAIRASLSNHSLQAEAGAGLGAGASAPLTAKTRSSPSLAPPRKKEVTSKIASLWKKVEDTRLQQKHSAKFGPKDTRVWISPAPAASPTPAPSCGQRRPSVERPAAAGRLSVFAGGPSRAAIVPPFNYSPPAPSPAPTTAAAKEEGVASVRVTSV